MAICFEIADGLIRRSGEEIKIGTDYSWRFSVGTMEAMDRLDEGDSLYSQGEYAESVLAYDEAIRLDPECARAWNNKAAALAGLGRYAEAIRCSDEAIRLDPHLSWPWNNRGFALRNLGRVDEALRAYDEALRLDPESVKVWYNRAAALEALGRAEEAEAAYARARELTLKREATSDSKGQK